MKTRIEFEVETLCAALQAGIDALDEIGDELSTYGRGYRDGKMEVIDRLKRILKEVSE